MNPGNTTILGTDPFTIADVETGTGRTKMTRRAMGTFNIQRPM
jgi:hypothetical protein